VPRAEARFEAIGTLWSIDTPAPLAHSTLDRVRAVVDAYDRVWSRFRADSVVSRMAREGGTHDLPTHAAELLDLYDVLEERTRGAVTPLVGRSLERLGYDATYRLRPDGTPLAVRSGTRTRDVLTRHVRDGQGLTVTAARPVLLDVGAAGKGQLVDLVAAELRACGVGEYLVDAGGDMLHRGPHVVRVGLQVPGDPGRVLGVVELRDAALCASAVDRRSWGDGLHHVLDARTGAPTQGVVATWVVAERAMVADGLATALFLADADVLQGVAEHTYVQLHADSRARVALALQGEVFAARLRPTQQRVQPVDERHGRGRAVGGGADEVPRRLPDRAGPVLTDAAAHQAAGAQPDDEDHAHGQLDVVASDLRDRDGHGDHEQDQDPQQDGDRPDAVRGAHLRPADHRLVEEARQRGSPHALVLPGGTHPPGAGAPGG